MFYVTAHLLRLPEAFAVCSSTLSNRALFHDGCPCEPFKMVLLMNYAVSWGTGRELVSCFLGCLSGTRQYFQWMPPTPELAITGTDYNQPLAPWQRKANGAAFRALLHAVCMCLSSVDVPVICTGWTNRLLIAPVIAQEMFCQLHPFFLMCSTSLCSSIELSWRGEQRTG